MSIINPNGKDILRVSTELCGKTLTLEVNRVGFRATGSVLVTYGDTVVLGSTVVGTKPVLLDYFPLSIDYEEKFYASGKISSSRFIKREGRPSDEAVLIGRLIDRPIRPLFPKGYRQEVQIVTTVLSMDPSFRPDVIGMIAASAALNLTGTPFDGPIAGLRIGIVNGEFKAFLSPEEREASDLDLVVAAKDDGITMVEAGAKEVSEETIVEAMDWAFKAMQPAIELQKELREKVGVEDLEYNLVLPAEDIQKTADAWVDGKLGEKTRFPYPERNSILNNLRWAFHIDMAENLGKGDTIEEKTADYAPLRDQYDEAFTSAIHKDVREGIVKVGLRPDGRRLDEVRPLSSETSILPRTHGSSIFTRGVTQALNVVTLAPLSFAQLVDTMEVTDGERRYMHHYNAPGYTVGECHRMGSPVAAKSATATSPNARSFPFSPPKKISLTPSAPLPKSCPKTALPPWQPPAPPAWHSWTPASRSNPQFLASPWVS